MGAESSIAEEIDFGLDGLVPAAVTDWPTGRLLVLCYLNEEALRLTLESGLVHLYRRSQGRVQKKGVESGHVQRVREIRLNCDGNSLELRVDQEVAACARGYHSCYYRRWNRDEQRWEIVDERIFDPNQVYT
ncbi:MAG: hypothetical protein OXG13_16375 [Gemmatimonadaceae bacterium]|nr:hypothetical protein [Gemmatimonadaceae bacterium]